MLLVSQRNESWRKTWGAYSLSTIFHQSRVNSKPALCCHFNVVNTPKGMDLCRRTVNTHVGLAVTVTVQDGGRVPVLIFVDIWSNVQMPRGTESEYVKLMKRPHPCFFYAIHRAEEEEERAVAFSHQVPLNREAAS